MTDLSGVTEKCDAQATSVGTLQTEVQTELDRKQPLSDKVISNGEAIAALQSTESL